MIVKNESHVILNTLKTRDPFEYSLVNNESVKNILPVSWYTLLCFPSKSITVLYSDSNFCPNDNMVIKTNANVSILFILLCFRLYYKYLIKGH